MKVFGEHRAHTSRPTVLSGRGCGYFSGAAVIAIWTGIFYRGLELTALGLRLPEIWFICGQAQMRALTQDGWGHWLPLSCSLIHRLARFKVRMINDIWFYPGGWTTCISYMRHSFFEYMKCRPVGLNRLDNNHKSRVVCLLVCIFCKRAILLFNLHVSLHWVAGVEFIVSNQHRC